MNKNPRSAGNETPRIFDSINELQLKFSKQFFSSCSVSYHRLKFAQSFFKHPLK